MLKLYTRLTRPTIRLFATKKEEELGDMLSKITEGTEYDRKLDAMIEGMAAKGLTEDQILAEF